MSETPKTAPGRCPHCGAGLLSGQTTCLKCGLATRAEGAGPPSRRIDPRIVGGVLAVLAAIAIVVLLLGSGGDDDSEKQTPSTAPASSERVEELGDCLGSPADLMPVFAPTVGLAEAGGGGAVAARFGEQKVQIIVFDSPGAAQTGFRNAQDQLIALEQSDPQAFARLAAKMQVVDSSIQIVARGALSPSASAKVTGCLARG